MLAEGALGSVDGVSLEEFFLRPATDWFA